MSVATCYCAKCEQRATVYDVGGSKCDSCFQQAIIHQLKTTISRKGLAHFGDRIGVAASGGYSSQALVELLGRCLSERQDGKASRMKLHVTIFHVDFELPFHNSNHSLQVIRQLAAKYGFPVCAASDTQGGQQLWKETCEKIDWKLVKDMSDLEELSRIAVYRWIAYVAKSHGCKVVFDGLSASRICKNILTSLSSGNGFHIPFQVSPLDISKSFFDVCIHHPQYEITDRQLMRYVWMRKIAFIAPNLRLLKPMSSVDSLTMSFLNDLEEQHRSTIPNILKTSSKIAVPVEFSHCSFCRTPVSSNEKPSTWNNGEQVVILCKACQHRRERMPKETFQLFLLSFMALDKAF